MMEISKAYVETTGNNRMEAEMQDVHEVLQSRNIPVELFTSNFSDRTGVMRQRVVYDKNAIKFDTII